ncbi:hypothetical protein AB691_0253 [Stutzerimonas stutzeri]|nr:hypothetical protein AB691_0253 [Stutzerimonas stutzeri]
MGQAVGAVNEVQQAGALRAERAAVDRVIGVAFDVDDVLCDVLAAAALAVEDQPAADGAVGAGVAGFTGVGQFEMPDRLGIRRRRAIPNAAMLDAPRPTPQTLKNCRRCMSIGGSPSYQAETPMLCRRLLKQLSQAFGK